MGVQQKLGLLTTSRHASIDQEKNRFLTFSVPVKCASTMCHGRFFKFIFIVPHVNLFFLVPIDTTMHCPLEVIPFLSLSRNNFIFFSLGLIPNTYPFEYLNVANMLGINLEMAFPCAIALW